jgi:NAD(P)-dependent dehydrogenase (short-subunit alcohol dehydrogenase family)
MYLTDAGGGGAIGRAVVRKLAREGARVAFIDLDDNGGNETMRYT